MRNTDLGEGDADAVAPAAGAARLVPVALALAVACAAFLVGYRVLVDGHPDEDAYILYRYSENVAAGGGVAFNAGGEHVDGATDFLWMLLLAGLVRLGCDVAVGATALNALGTGLAAGILARVIWRARLPALPRALLLALPASLVVFHGALAGYAGFSTALYSLLYLLPLAIAFESRGRMLLALPLLGLTLGLFRPDGVLPGVAYALLGLVLARRAGRLRPYCASLAAGAAIGVAYVVWRRLYLGVVIPLPLYVKGRPHVLDAGVGGLRGAWRALRTAMPGIDGHWRWLFRGDYSPWAVLAALTGFALLLRHRRPRDLGRLGALLIPAAVLFAVLCLGTQAQNVAYRFQAPISLCLLFALVAVGVSALQDLRRPAQRAFALAATLVVGLLPALRGGLPRPPERQYADTFAQMLGARLTPDDVFALTEAGRFAFWTDAAVVDLVGLNTRHTALVPPDPAYIASLDPVVLMYHQTHTLDPAELVPAHESAPPVVPLTRERLRAAVREPFRALVARGADAYDDPLAAEHVFYETTASLVTRFLVEADGYDLFAVDYNGDHRYQHVFAFRAGWPHTAEVVRDMESALRFETFRSYLDVRDRAR